MTDAPPSTRTGRELVRVDAVAKSFGGTRAVRGASFSVAAGEIHALCGHNGAGKSTVVKLLSGQEIPDSGSISIGGQAVDLRTRQAAQRCGVALVDQELSVVPSLTVAENLMLGDLSTGWLNGGRRADARFRALLDSVGLESVGLRQRLSELSIGQRQLIEIARALGQDARLVILDEPTATLSDVESEYVYASVRKVASAGCAVLFVSHRLGEVLDLCDNVTVMRDGVVVATSAASDLTIDSLIYQMLGDVPQRAEHGAANRDRGAVVLSIDGLSVPGRVQDFSLSLQSGRLYAVAGQLGSGASDVLRAVGGLVPAATSSIAVDGAKVRVRTPAGAVRAGIAFVSNDRKSEGLFLGKPIGWNLLATRLLQVSRLGVVSRSRWTAAVTRLAKLCGLELRLAQPVTSLSGGNQQKVFVARCLGRDDVRALVLDEPTRGVDVGGRAAIHALLRQAADDGMTVLFATTELEELQDLADVVVTMHKGRVVQRHEGHTASAVLLREMMHGAPT